MGFQSKTPSTDFRATGVLALHTLHYFTQAYAHHTRSILTRVQALDVTNGWYSFATVFINLVHLTLGCVKEGAARYWFYEHGTGLDVFGALVAWVMIEFDTMWVEKRLKVMEFEGFVRGTFREGVRRAMVERCVVMMEEDTTGHVLVEGTHQGESTTLRQRKQTSTA